MARIQNRIDLAATLIREYSAFLKPDYNYRMGP